jgi:hypothetical protein
MNPAFAVRILDAFDVTFIRVPTTGGRLPRLGGYSMEASMLLASGNAA